MFTRLLPIKNPAFTLAEVLITLLIIGVVSSLVIPALINDIQNAEYKTAYKKAFAVATQALMSANSEYLLISTSAWSDVSNDNNFNAFKTKFNVTIDCNSNNNTNCWAYNEKELFLGSFPFLNGLAFVDNSGMAWSRTALGGGFGFELLVDTNALKPPNVYGKDRFIFYIRPDSYPGIPKNLNIGNDSVGISGSCPSGNCYYKTWMK
jgi:prepilin-type N-terminal cleavage/methylation domain-containing protein